MWTLFIVFPIVGVFFVDKVNYNGGQTNSAAKIGGQSERQGSPATNFYSSKSDHVPVTPDKDAQPVSPLETKSVYSADLMAIESRDLGSQSPPENKPPVA